MCNCRKKATQQTPPPPPPPTTSLTASAAPGARSFSLTTPDGRRRTFGSRLEANAERVRLGGVGTVTES